MAERPSKGAEIPIRTLGGLNERPSPANLRPGEFDVLEGLYPKNVGLLARIPGKTLLASVEGVVRQIRDTQNINHDVLIQADGTLYAFTVDELRGRASTSNLTFNAVTEEETMSMAIIVQKEPSGTSATSNGGSASGFQAGSPNEAAATFYGRRLTHLISDPNGIVATFTASTGGNTAASANGTFALAPGTYRISIAATFGFASTDNALFGLYNVTSAAFELTGTVPIISSPILAPGEVANRIATLEGVFTVSSTTKTYAIYQQGSRTNAARDVHFGGYPVATSGTMGTVNGAAPENIYCTVKILKTA